MAEDEKAYAAGSWSGRVAAANARRDNVVDVATKNRVRAALIHVSNLRAKLADDLGHNELVVLRADLIDAEGVLAEAEKAHLEFEAASATDTGAALADENDSLRAQVADLTARLAAADAEVARLTVLLPPVGEDGGANQSGAGADDFGPPNGKPKRK